MSQHQQNFNVTRKERAVSMRHLIAAKELSPSGADYVTLSLDPFHDFNRPIAGYPDADSYDTVVSVRNYEYTLSKPAASAANWDAHIFTLPFDSTRFYNGNSVGGMFTQTAETYTMGLVTVAKDDAGGPLFPTALPVASANFEMDYINTFDGVQDGMSRIIGMGLEVIDVTAALTKQGSLVAYKMPVVNNTQILLGFANTADTVHGVMMPKIINAPPSTVAEAVLYRSSVQWEAKDGAYVVIGPQGVDNPFTLPSNIALAVTKDSLFAGTDQCLVGYHTPLTAPQAAPLLTLLKADSSVKMLNVAQMGVMLTGLDNSAVFKVRVRVFVERAPMRGDTDLIPLATPSASYDYKALALRTLIAGHLPIAVPVSFNAKGDWWRIIVNTLKSVIPVAGTALSGYLGPEAGILGNAIGALIPQQKVGGRAKAQKKKQLPLRS